MQKKANIGADIDLIVKAYDLTAKAKDFEAKATASVLQDPRGQGLVLEDTSLHTQQTITRFQSTLLKKL